ncbi:MULTISPECIES: hypothetical protein [Acinetobacter]|uniref:Uncharacterized protein n=2 Tax=Acinetobacter TaxID=469 RepID=A0A6C0Y6J4_9GAMM|nr:MULTISPECIES: hypothetical protein [Acinetobacter]QIC71864.1 hypothetical protein FSC09_15860 [Acinetobacter indicus]QKQ71400.1 hypothetical protein E5Y90_14310 [Acinetobacter sp. 10FS3-1]
MDAQLKAKLEELVNADQAVCFDLKTKQWVDFPHCDFLDNDAFLPPLKQHEDGYRSAVLAVLISRPTAYGPTLSVCTGYLQVTADTDETDLVRSLEWCSADGEDVVGWMKLPVFHKGDQTTLKHDQTGDKGFYFIMSMDTVQ